MTASNAAYNRRRARRATARAGSMITSRNPATGRVVFETTPADTRAVAHAVERAAAAAAEWAGVPVTVRARVLRRFADLVDRDADELTAAIVAEVGKVAREARGEVEWTALSARWYADHPPESERRGGAVVRRRPLGVVAAVTPWNVPLITPAWKWLPALMAGNSVVWKPSELATGVAVAARARLQEAGLPPGLLEVVPGGPETARALCEHPDVAAVHFTGSTRAGKAIAEVATASLKRCALEMGGLNFAIVFADADLDAAAESIAAAATSINGQKCTATRRVLVDRTVAEEVVSLLADRYEDLVTGDPADEATTLGPLITPAARDAADREVERALAAGARVAARAPEAAGDGIDRAAFFRATLLTDLAADDPLRTRELFAPVLSVEAFAEAPEAWRAANESPYGLTGSVYTSDPATATAACEQVRTGILALNRRSDAVELEAPFGGVKDSGNGFREGGTYIYDSLTELQAVYGQEPPP
jgi:alpha-ketoglutaric semialdehyde dehydrogenase